MKANAGDEIVIIAPKHSWGIYKEGDRFIVESRWLNDKGVWVQLNENTDLQLYDHEYKLMKKE